DRLAGASEQRLDGLAAGGMQRPVLPRWGDDGAPGARGPRIAQADLGDRLLELARLILRADHMEGVVFEHPDADAVPVDPAVLALAPVRDGFSGAGEALALEGAVHHRGDPPRGDGVLAQLEQPGTHRPA